MIWVSDRLKRLLREVRHSIGNLLARESFRAFLILFSVFAFSAIGFFVFEREAYEAFYHEPLTFFDALWWAVVTTATVGYGDIIPLTDIGRIFGMITILAGMGSFGLFAGIMSTFLASFGQREQDLRKARRTSNHVIVCGFNTNILHLLTRLKDYFLQVVMIANIPRPENLPNYVCFIHGECSEELVLLKAGVTRARVVVVSLENDSEALLTISAIKGQNPHTSIICNLRSLDNLVSFERVGADSLFSSQYLCGEQLANKFLQVIEEKGVAFLSHVAICGWNDQIRLLFSLLDPTLFHYKLILDKNIQSPLIPEEVELLCGNIADESMLKQARVQDCAIAIVSKDDDAGALLAVLSMKQANPKIVTICDLRQARHQYHLKRAGVDYCFSEEELSGEEFLHFIRSKYDLLIK